MTIGSRSAIAWQGSTKRRRAVVVCVTIWIAAAYVHYLANTKSFELSETAVLHFIDAPAELVRNEQNWRAVVGADSNTEWLRKTNIRITINDGHHLEAHCKSAVTACELIRQAPNARLDGDAIKVRFEPGGWLLAVSHQGRAILNRAEQLNLMREGASFAMGAYLFLYGLATILTLRILKPSRKTGHFD